MSIWDDPDMRRGGNYVTFANTGDTVSGQITGITFHTFEDGAKVPKLFLRCDDGEERTMTAGQVQLKSKLAEMRPEAGDHLTVTLVGVEKLPGAKTLKKFDVVVRRAGASGVDADSLV